jgi:hypothetical protein
MQRAKKWLEAGRGSKGGGIQGRPSGEAVPQEEAIDCHVQEVICHVQGPKADIEDVDCHVQEVDCHAQGPKGGMEDVDCHVQGPKWEVEAIDCHGRSAKAACRARRTHRQTVKRAERRRNDRQGLRAAILDDHPDPIYITNMGRGQGHFTRRKLLRARVKLDNHELVALVDSGCEVELVLSHRLEFCETRARVTNLTSITLCLLVR